MGFSVDDIREVGTIRYDGEPLNSVEQVFERLYEPTRRMARDHPQISRRGKEDSYQTGYFGGGDIQELEDRQQEELQKDIDVELFLEGEAEPVIYEVRQINDNTKRYASNAPCSVLLEGENDDRFVLHEAKDYEDPSNAFHFGQKSGVERFRDNEQDSGYLSIHGFFEGIKGVHDTLAAADGLSPLLPQIGVIQDTEGYDPHAAQQTYYVRDFDDQAVRREEFPEVDKLAGLAATLDTLGVRREDSDPYEILHSDEGFLYEADLEKLSLVEGTPTGEERKQPGLSRIEDIFDRIHRHPEGGDLQVEGEKVRSNEIKDALRTEYPVPDIDPAELREQFRDGISRWNPSDLTGPFVDLRN